jgi:hypothetical protein
MRMESRLVKLVAFISTLIRYNCVAYREIEVRQVRHPRQEFGKRLRRMGLSVFESQRVHTTGMVPRAENNSPKSKGTNPVLPEEEQAWSQRRLLAVLP